MSRLGWKIAQSLPSPPSPAARTRATCTGLGFPWCQRCAPGRATAPLDWRGARGYVASARIPELACTSPPPLFPSLARPNPARQRPFLSPLPSPDFSRSVRAPGRSIASRAPGPRKPSAYSSRFSSQPFLVPDWPEDPGQQRRRDDRADGVFDPFFVRNPLERGSGPQYYQPAPHK